MLFGTTSLTPPTMLVKLDDHLKGKMFFRFSSYVLRLLCVIFFFKFPDGHTASVQSGHGAGNTDGVLVLKAKNIYQTTEQEASKI